MSVSKQLGVVATIFGVGLFGPGLSDAAESVGLPGDIQAVSPIDVSQPVAINQLGRSSFQTFLVVRERESTSRQDEIVSQGVPFPRGLVFSARMIQVAGADGILVPLQARPLGSRWPDGSWRWGLLTFPATVVAGGNSIYRLSVSNTVIPRPESSKSLVHSNPQGGVDIDTGALRFSLNPKCQGVPFLPDQVEIDGRELVAQPVQVHLRYRQEGGGPDQILNSGSSGFRVGRSEPFRQGFEHAGQHLEPEILLVS